MNKSLTFKNHQRKGHQDVCLLQLTNNLKFLKLKGLVSQILAALSITAMQTPNSYDYTIEYSNINPLSPNSDQNQIYLYSITTNLFKIQVMRIKRVITKDKMSRYLDKFSSLVP